MMKSLLLNKYTMGTLLLLTVVSYFYFQEGKIEKLETKVEEQEVSITVIEEQKEVEIFEERWQTIAKENNKSEEMHHEEPITHPVTHVTDFVFFKWMPDQN